MKNRKLYVLAAAVAVVLGLLFTDKLDSESAFGALKAIFAEAVEDTPTEGTIE